MRNALAGAQRKKSNLLQAKLNDPDLFTDAEFKEEKQRLQNEITELQKSIREAEDGLEQVRQTVENVFDFAVNAAHNFEHGNTKLRKEIAARLGFKYFLTLGKLEIKPHPLLVPILGIEPLEKGFHSKKDGSFKAARPSWLGMRDEILNLAKEGKQFPKVMWKSQVESMCQ